MRRLTTVVLVLLSSAIVGAQVKPTNDHTSARSLATSSVRVIANRANVRLQPTATSPAIVAVTAGTVIEVEAREGDWYRVVFPPDAQGLRKVGYISATLVELFVPSPSQTAQSPAAPPPSVASPSAAPAPSAAVPKPSPTPEARTESPASQQIEKDPPLRRAANKVAGLWRRNPSAQKGSGTVKGQESESTDDTTAEAGKAAKDSRPTGATETKTAHDKVKPAESEKQKDHKKGEATFTVNFPSERVFTASLRALAEMEANVKSTEKSSGVITAEHEAGTANFSFFVSVKTVDAGRSEVFVKVTRNQKEHADITLSLAAGGNVDKLAERFQKTLLAKLGS